MDKIQDAVNRLEILGENEPFWKNIPKAKVDIANIISEFNREDGLAIRNKLRERWDDYSTKEKNYLGGLTVEVNNNIKGVLGDSEGDPVDIDDIPTITDPVDPEENPDDVHGDDDKPDFEDESLRGKTEVRTRGQKIKSDSYDYKKNYPGSGKMNDIETVVNNILGNRIGLSNEDKQTLSKMQTLDQQKSYLREIVQGQRHSVESSKQKRKFNHLIDECCNIIPEYLSKEYGKDIANKMSELPNRNRIRLVGEYDFSNVAGEYHGACGIFRTREGDVYLSQKYLKTQENKPHIGERKNSVFPRIYWEIKSILIHELLHSKSVLNYRGERASTRRMGLGQANYNKKVYRGYGGNEGTTENLSQKILRYLYVDKEGLNTYDPPREGYQNEQKVIQKLIDKVSGNTSNKLEWKDFHKAMLLRKYGNDKNIKGPTPLVELLRKVNGGKEIKSQTRPYFYQIVMDLIDLVNKGNMGIDIILEFINTQDISILKNHFGVSLSSAIKNKRFLLNSDETDFNNTILKAYGDNTLDDGSEYVDYEDVDEDMTPEENEEGKKPKKAKKKAVDTQNEANQYLSSNPEIQELLEDIERDVSLENIDLSNIGVTFFWGTSAMGTKGQKSDQSREGMFRKRDYYSGFDTSSNKGDYLAKISSLNALMRCIGGVGEKYKNGSTRTGASFGISIEYLPEGLSEKQKDKIWELIGNIMRVVIRSSAFPSITGNGDFNKPIYVFENGMETQELKNLEMLTKEIIEEYQISYNLLHLEQDNNIVSDTSQLEKSISISSEVDTLSEEIINKINSIIAEFKDREDFTENYYSKLCEDIRKRMKEEGIDINEYNSKMIELLEERAKEKDKEKNDKAQERLEVMKSSIFNTGLLNQLLTTDESDIKLELNGISNMILNKYWLEIKKALPDIEELNIIGGDNNYLSIDDNNEIDSNVLDNIKHNIEKLNLSNNYIKRLDWLRGNNNFKKVDLSNGVLKELTYDDLIDLGEDCKLILKGNYIDKKTGNIEEVKCKIIK